MDITERKIFLDVLLSFLSTVSFHYIKTSSSMIQLENDCLSLQKYENGQIFFPPPPLLLLGEHQSRSLESHASMKQRHTRTTTKGLSFIFCCLKCVSSHDFERLIGRKQFWLVATEVVASSSSKTAFFFYAIEAMAFHAVVEAKDSPVPCRIERHGSHTSSVRQKACDDTLFLGSILLVLLLRLESLTRFPTNHHQPTP